MSLLAIPKIIQGGQHINRKFLLLLDEMDVGVVSEGDISKAQQFGDNLRVNTALEKHACKGMYRFMESPASARSADSVCQTTQNITTTTKTDFCALG